MISFLVSVQKEIQSPECASCSKTSINRKKLLQLEKVTLWKWEEEAPGHVRNQHNAMVDALKVTTNRASPPQSWPTADVPWGSILGMASRRAMWLSKNFGVNFMTWTVIHHSNQLMTLASEGFLACLTNKLRGFFTTFSWASGARPKAEWSCEFILALRLMICQKCLNFT